MPSTRAPAMRIYKICALLGTLVIMLDIGLSLQRIQSFESSVAEVFESQVRAQMEIDGLQQEISHIDKVREQADTQIEDQASEKATDRKAQEGTTVDNIDYTPYEVERLRNELRNLKLLMQEKKLDLVESGSEKKYIMNEVRALFFLSLIFLVIGTLLAAFGYLAWYFKIELFEDRRKRPR
ncbi:hypothetical protein MNBD_GAMMA11-2936 [hydrothermal vent metagenome]|uniref:Uncharacterized protein n=1 Tax=hydrothermal vent metagenome TaxID=652676 RepID=A0A3B0X2Z5_9ZZZZ